MGPLLEDSLCLKLPSVALLGYASSKDEVVCTLLDFRVEFDPVSRSGEVSELLGLALGLRVDRGGEGDLFLDSDKHPVTAEAQGGVVTSEQKGVIL